MSFWEEQGQQTGPPSLQELVESENPDLDEVLHHEHCFQDVRVGAKYIVEFFSQHKILQELLNRCIYAQPDPNLDPVDQYKQSPRAIGIIGMNNTHINNSLLNDQVLMDGILSYLAPRDDPLINDVKAGFYKRLVLALLNTSDMTDGTFLDTLKDSKFMDYCFESMDYGAVAELFVRIPTQCQNEKVQTRIFQWYADAKVANRLSHLFTPDASLDILENASFIWSEFEEMQLRRVENADPFKDALYSTETLAILLDSAFPVSGPSHPRVINYVAPIIVYFVEVNRTQNEPAHRVFPDLYMREPIEETGDPEWKLQLLIIERAEQIVRLAIEYGNAPDSEKKAMAASKCLKVIRALTNTNHMPTHVKLANVFSNPETSIVKLLEITEKNPLFAIFNNHVHGIVGYSLYSNTEDKHPLIDAFFKTEPNLFACIMSNVKRQSPRPGETEFEADGRVSFFLKLGELINSARNERTPRATYITELLYATEEFAQQWQEMSTSTLHDFSESNRSHVVNTTTSCRTMDESLGDIDEVGTMTDRENGDPTKPIYVMDPLETKLPPAVGTETTEDPAQAQVEEETSS